MDRREAEGSGMGGDEGRSERSAPSESPGGTAPAHEEAASQQEIAKQTGVGDSPGETAGRWPVRKMGQSEGGPSLEPGTLLRVGAAVEGGLILLAVGVGWLTGQPIWTKIHGSVEDALWGAILTGPLLAGLWLGVNYPWGPWRGLVRVLEEFVIPLFRRCRVWQLAAISLLAGVGEEMLFRGALQDGLAQWLGGSLGLGETAGLWLAVVLASGLFGLLHWVSPFYALLAGLIGAYLGWQRIHSGNLLGPIVSHALYDFVALVYLTKLWCPR